MAEAKKVILKNKNGELLVPYAEVSMNDIDNLAEDINNLIPANANTISGLGSPSTSYEDLTFTTGTDYIAPANGWFYLDRKATANGQYMALNSKTRGYRTVVAGYSGIDSALILPVLKGDVVGIGSNFGTSGNFRFYYAEGEVQ